MSGIKEDKTIEDRISMEIVVDAYNKELTSILLARCRQVLKDFGKIATKHNRIYGILYQELQSRKSRMEMKQPGKATLKAFDGG